jgi:hypothetical protein
MYSIYSMHSLVKRKHQAANATWFKLSKNHHSSERRGGAGRGRNNRVSPRLFVSLGEETKFIGGRNLVNYN